MAVVCRALLRRAIDHHASGLSCPMDGVDQLREKDSPAGHCAEMFCGGVGVDRRHRHGYPGQRSTANPVRRLEPFWLSRGER